jgi:nucleoside-diphosphate-sugar epimerase
LPTSRAFRTVDVSRLRDEFGYQPEYDLEQGVREYIY